MKLARCCEVVGEGCAEFQRRKIGRTQENCQSISDLSQTYSQFACCNKKTMKHHIYDTWEWRSTEQPQSYKTSNLRDFCLRSGANIFQLDRHFCKSSIINTKEPRVFTPSPNDFAVHFCGAKMASIRSTEAWSSQIFGWTVQNWLGPIGMDYILGFTLLKVMMGWFWLQWLGFGTLLRSHNDRPSV